MERQQPLVAIPWAEGWLILPVDVTAIEIVVEDECGQLVCAIQGAEAKGCWELLRAKGADHYVWFCVVVSLSQVALDFLFGFSEGRVIAKVVNGVVPDLGGLGRVISAFPEAKENVVVDLLIGVAGDCQAGRQSLNRVKLGDPVDVADSERIGIFGHVSNPWNIHARNNPQNQPVDNVVPSLKI